MQPLFSRHIRSFVMRSGHITEGQKSARDRLLPQWSIPFGAEPIDFKDVFQRDGSIILEIGFGMGETTAAMAESHPDWNIVGVEVYRAGVGSLLARIEKRQLQNIRIIEHDAVEVLGQMIRDESLDAVHIYFPDPWPKKRHHKRRLIQPAFIAALARKIRQGGIVHMATDWPDYAEQMLAVCSIEPLLVNTSATGYCPRPPWRPMTKFESRGMRLGNPVADLIFQKR
jgi:tRNA (guanine-N7-)-methyltransferase